MPSSRETRLVVIARAYRDALAEHAPVRCAEIDNEMQRTGDWWITGGKPPHLNPDEPMTAKELADWHGVTVATICNHTKRHGITPTEIRKRGRKTYRLSDFKMTSV